MTKITLRLDLGIFVLDAPRRLDAGRCTFVYYVDPTFAGGTITPIATQNDANFLNLPGYFLIGSLVTPASSLRYQPSS